MADTPFEEQLKKADDVTSDTSAFIRKQKNEREELDDDIIAKIKQQEEKQEINRKGGGHAITTTAALEDKQKKQDQTIEDEKDKKAGKGTQKTSKEKPEPDQNTEADTPRNVPVNKTSVSTERPRGNISQPTQTKIEPPKLRIVLPEEDRAPENIKLQPTQNSTPTPQRRNGLNGRFQQTRPKKQAKLIYRIDSAAARSMYERAIFFWAIGFIPVVNIFTQCIYVYLLNKGLIKRKIYIFKNPDIKTSAIVNLILGLIPFVDWIPTQIYAVHKIINTTRTEDIKTYKEASTRENILKMPQAKKNARDNQRMAA